MPDKDKTEKPKAKVEEVAEESSVLTPPKATEEVAEPPKVASFSQLDTKEASTEKPIEIEKEVPSEVKSDIESAETTDTSDTSMSEPKKDISSDEVKEWLKEVRPDTTKENEKSASGLILA